MNAQPPVSSSNRLEGSGTDAVECTPKEWPDHSAMEEAAAKKMGAVTTTLPTCHMVMLQQPAAVAGVIDDAARNALTNKKAATTS